MYDFHYNHIQEVNTEVTERGFCSQTQTASATKFRPTICTTTWQETSSTMTPVWILKPTLCTAPSTQRSQVNLRTKPTLFRPKNLWDWGQKCIVWNVHIQKWRPRELKRVTSNVTYGIPHSSMPYVINSSHPRLVLKPLDPSIIHQSVHSTSRKPAYLPLWTRNDTSYRTEFRLLHMAIIICVTCK